MIYLWIALGSAVGGASRYWCYGWAARHLGDAFPWGTLVVNIAGSSIIGLFATLSGPEGRLLIGSSTRQLVMAGFCGGFTTFSTFSLETLNLARDGQWGWATANILASVGCCLLGVWLGHTAATLINGR